MARHEDVSIDKIVLSRNINEGRINSKLVWPTTSYDGLQDYSKRFFINKELTILDDIVSELHIEGS